MSLKHFSILIFIGLLMLSCGGNRSSDEGKDGSPGLSEAVGGFRNLNKAAKAAEDWEKKQSDLQSKTPLTNDEMKAVLPESLAGMKRTRFSVGDASMMGLAYYIPFIDNLIDTIATPLSIVAGTLLMTSVFPAENEWMKWILGFIVGGGAAATIQSGSTITRLFSS
jgi:hypothetical protein